MKRSHEIIIAIPIFGTIGILLLILNFGYCFLIPCETVVEIISIEVPEKIYRDKTFQADFTIKNKGENPARCVIDWDLNVDKYTIDDSDYVPIQPQQEIIIRLEGASSMSRYELCSSSTTIEVKSSARVTCKNTMSALIKQTILLEC